MCIRDSSGVVDKNAIGAENADSVLHRIVREYGSDFAADFLSKLSKVLDRFLSSWGFSMGPQDLVLDAEAYKEISRILDEGRRKVESLIDAYKKGELKPIRGYTLEETLERLILDTLSKARDESGKIALKSLRKENPLYVMTATGARGSTLNVAQLTAVLGQQSIRGERPKRGFNDRVLSVFKPGDYGASARGFVFNSFLSGLSPTEFFFHAIGGREGLVDTAVRTSQSGYFQRRLINALQDLEVKYDGTVRETRGVIVQFEYGEDGVDPSRGDYGKSVNVDRIIELVTAEGE